MKTILTITVNNGRQVGNFHIEFPSAAKAYAALTNAISPLTQGGIFCAEQLCFDLLIDGIPVEQSRQ